MDVMKFVSLSSFAIAFQLTYFLINGVTASARRCALFGALSLSAKARFLARAQFLQVA
jgi:hypothetical protein